MGWVWGGKEGGYLQTGRGLMYCMQYDMTLFQAVFSLFQTVLPNFGCVLPYCDCVNPGLRLYFLPVSGCVLPS